MKIAIFGISAGCAAAFSINLCATIFCCGCRSWWAGMGEHCNIHQAGMRHCPWCASNVWFPAAMLLILAAQGLVSFWPGKWHWTIRLCLALAAFPAVGFLVAGIAGLASGYWRS